MQRALIILVVPSGKRFRAAKPYTSGVAPSRRRLGGILKFVVAAYIAALAALPFAHHDLACHLKSSTHCGVCHVGTSTDDAGVQPGLGQAHLADVGGLGVYQTSGVVSCVLLPSSGRSPPPVANSLL